jgi:trans-2,3-dihydro-3-hydroxyanthranilate isomerase
MRYQFHTVDVFADRIFGGNPLAVFPDAEGLTEAQMQLVAREFNISETTFVFPPKDPANAARLRIYTPKVELPFAGHPTVGTSYVLAALGRVRLAEGEVRIVLEENVGPVPVTIRVRNGRPVFTQLSTAQPPEFGPPPPASAELASVLSLKEADILAGERAPQAVSCGLPWLIVPVASRGAIARARLRPERYEAVLGNYWSRGVYLVTLDTGPLGSDVHARMYAPAIAPHEDPATGSAAASLAGYLAAREKEDGTRRWRVTQGHEMGRPSLIEIEADRAGEKITSVRVGGASVLVSEGEMEVPAV